MNDAFVYGGVRTPFGRYGGGLSSVRPDDLAAMTIKETVARYDVPGETVDDVILGCATQAGEDCRNIARHALLLAGLPDSVPAQTNNRLCGSGLAAIVDAVRVVGCGHGDLLLAGGVEGMSRAPLVMPKAETAFSRSTEMYDSTIGSRFPNKALTALYGNDTMPQTSDNVAKDHGISREDSDAFAARSQERYAAALASGVFEDEIMPVTVKAGKKGETAEIKADEHPRPGSTVEKLAGLKPLFEGGVTTAGNASGVNDGAATLVIGAQSVGDRIGHAPMARVLSAAVAGVPPRVMGLGPVPAAQKALERAGLTLADMDVIEINEAFAAQVLGCLKLLGLPGDDARVNPNGGAIAVGHPLGASGARITLTTARHLQRTGGRYALVSLCIGVGQGIAMVMERV